MNIKFDIKIESSWVVQTLEGVKMVLGTNISTLKNKEIELLGKMGSPSLRPFEFP